MGFVHLWGWPPLLFLLWYNENEADDIPRGSAVCTGAALIVYAVLGDIEAENAFVAAIGAAALAVLSLAKIEFVHMRANALISASVSYGIHFANSGSTPVFGTALFVISLVFPSTNVEAQTVGAPSATLDVLKSIISHRDTRSIFYFFLLNFSFMLVQVLYSLLSHSLGLLSDSIHMLFDCAALLVGLVASILAKQPPSTRFPYGLGLVETISGFANGVLLLGISVSIIFEAIERLYHPVHLERLTELIVVSVCGLIVNLVGIFAFSHGHSHGHSHEHSHEHSHDHTHSDENEKNNHSHTHSHDSENMQGIFLHILADTMGSVGVIVASVLTYLTNHHTFDAIASVVISVLIFISAVPLVRSTGKTLLLSLTDAQEYQLRDVLNDISTTKGVVFYTVPRFWNDGGGVRGFLHVQHARGADPESLRCTIEQKLRAGGVKHSVVQMEVVGSSCWCHK